MSCCILDDGHSLGKALDAGLKPSDFELPIHRIVFGALTEMAATSVPVGQDTLYQHLGDRITGQELLSVTQEPTTAHFDHYLASVIKASRTRQAVAQAQLLIERAARGEDIIGDLPTTTQRKPVPITSFTYPQDKDPNILLGNDDYLGRGGGMLFVSHAGAGKSSWIMDACMMWALGKPWMGIKSNGPLRSLIIQAEDSDRYIGKVFASFAHVNKLTLDEHAQLTNNCLIVRRKGLTGGAFERELSTLCAQFKPDLVALNPIYLFAEGDITKSEYAQPFLVGLDRVNRDERWAYILIHHTGKPVRAANGKRPDVEDWESAYMGFGSSYFANWPRCSALLEPVADNPGHYTIKLGKGGLNAGVTKKVEQGIGYRLEPATRISIRHSTDRMPVNGQDKPVFYWEVDDQPPVPSVGESPKRGRPNAYDIKDFFRWIPTTREQAKPSAQIYRDTNGATGITDNGFKKMLFRASQDNTTGIILTDLPGRGACYWRRLEPAAS